MQMVRCFLGKKNKKLGTNNIFSSALHGNFEK